MFQHTVLFTIRSLFGLPSRNMRLLLHVKIVIVVDSMLLLNAIKVLEFASPVEVSAVRARLEMH